jgi:hypothetical protein
MDKFRQKFILVVSKTNYIQNNQISYPSDSFLKVTLKRRDFAIRFRYIRLQGSLVIAVSSTLRLSQQRHGALALSRKMSPSS